MRPKRTIPPPFKHQTKSIKFLQSTNRALDASDPGTGKTRVAIDWSSPTCHLPGEAVLVIAPKSLLQSAWEDDFRKFAPHVRTQVCLATKREASFALPADVYITNIDAAVWLAKQIPKFFKRFNRLVIDEGSAFKHPTSQRSRAINKIKKYFEYRLILTGTPNSNTIVDIWNLINILDDGKRLGKSYFHFRASVCAPVQVGPQPNMLKWEDKPGAEFAVSQLISDIVIRHKFEECIDIPPNYTYSVPFHMPPAQTKAYKQMEQQGIALFTNRAITTLNAAGVATKLLQICCLAQGTEVLTNSGWKPIESVTANDLVWDGTQWSKSYGSTCTGRTHVVDFDGVFMTPEHKVLTVSGWVTAEEILNVYDTPGFNRAPVRTPDCNTANWKQHQQEHSLAYAVPMWEASNACGVESTKPQSTVPKVLRMQSARSHPQCEWNAHANQHSAVLPLEQHSLSLQQPKRQRLGELRRAWDSGMRRMAEFIRSFRQRYGAIVQTWATTGSQRQQRPIFEGKLPLGYAQGAVKQHTSERVDRNAKRTHDHCTSSRSFQYENCDLSQTNSCERPKPIPPSEKVPVFDIVGVSPRPQFTVRGATGKVFIVHNSGATYSGTTGEEYVSIANERYELIADLIEQRANCVVFFNWKHQRDGLTKEFESRGITYTVIDGTTPPLARKTAVDHFQAGFYKVLLAHPQSAAHGLTLTKGTSTIWASPTYNLEHFIQGNKRIYRAGQTEKTETVVVIAPGTIEEHIFNVLQTKDARQTSMLDLLKDLFSEQ